MPQTQTLTLYPFDPVAKTYGAPVTKSLADWGIADDYSGQFKSAVENAIELQFPGNALAGAPGTVPAASIFTVRSRVIIKIDDKNFFNGYVAEDAREKTGQSDNQTLRLAGIWWWLENTPFKLPIQTLLSITDGVPVYQTQYFTHFDLNATWVPILAGNTLTYNFTNLGSRAMLKIILDGAIAKGCWLAYDDADLMDVPVLPMTVMDIPFSEAICYQIANYDAIVWFDENVSPPKIHICQRKDLPSFSRALCAGGTPDLTKHIEGFQPLKERTDLYVPYVQFLFEEPYSVGGVNSIISALDVYPNPPPADDFRALTHTVPLRGVQGLVHSQFIETEPIYPESVAWWQARKRETDPAVNPKAAIEYNSLAIIPGSSRRLLNLPNQIVAGSWSSWMSGSFGRDHVIAQASYHRMADGGRPGTKVSNHTWRAQCDCTNLDFPGGITLGLTSYSATGEDINAFIGMAELVYKDLNPAGGQWEGAIPLFETTFSGEIRMGLNFNLTGSLARHATMNAAVQGIAFRVRSGAIYFTLEIGPNKTLHPQQIISRMKAARLKYITVFNPFAAQSAQVTLPEGYGQDDNSNAEPGISEQNVHDDAGDGTTGHVWLRGNAGEPELGFGVRNPDNSLDDTAPSLSLKSADLIAIDAMNT